MKVFFLILSIAFSQIAFAEPGGWTTIDPSTVNNDKEIQDALIFGAHYVIEQGVDIFAIGNVNYDVTQIFHISKQVVNGINYNFDVEISGDDGSVGVAQYIVNVQPSNNTKQVLSWAAKVFGSGILTTEGEGEIEASEYKFLPEEVYVAEEEMQFAEAWIAVDPFQLYFDPDLQSALQFGVQQVIRKGRHNGTLSRRRYVLDSINSIEEQVNGLNYKFDVNLRGRRGALARVEFEVDTQLSTGRYELASYKFIYVKETK